MMEITGCIFDLDGTLLDSMPMWRNVGNNYLKSQGKNPKDDVDKLLRSMSLQQAAKFFITDYNLNLTQPEIMQGINDMIEGFYKNTVCVKPNVLNFLQKMKSKNVKMCIASATDKYLIEHALKVNNMCGYFSEIYSCTDVGFGKDNPHIYNIALNHLKTDKETTYIFEDALYAVKTAKQAGYKVVGVYDEASSDHTDEIKKLSDLFINSYTEIGSYFD